MTNAATLVRDTSQLLAAVSESPRLDAEILLAHALQKSRTWLYAHPEYQLLAEELSTFLTLRDKRQRGTPIAYLVGEREFWSMRLKVSEDTLIPRPETEHLVEITLELLKGKPDARVLDLGTGSGAIALALARERPQWQLYACDQSTKALGVARENAGHHGISNVTWLHSDWFSNIPKTLSFDAIVSNPPYIAESDPHLSQGDVRFEPRTALTSGEEGLTAIRHIVHYSKDRLTENGMLLIEHGYQQKHAVQQLMKMHAYEQIVTWQDWQGQDRVTAGRKSLAAEPLFRYK